MPKYIVTIERTEFYDVIVEADSQEDAAIKADKTWYDQMSSEPDSVDVQTGNIELMENA